MKRVFVAERNGEPITFHGGFHVETVPSPVIAEARMEVTPIPRLKTERMMPYVSVDTLEAFVTSDGTLEGLQALIASAWQGIRRD